MNFYDYYKNVCVCKGCIVHLGVKNINEIEAESWPLQVLNINLSFIGTASNRNEFLTIWNNDSINRTIGKLYLGFGLFGFILKSNKCGIHPSYVIGNKDGDEAELYRTIQTEENRTTNNGQNRTIIT